MLGVCPTSQIVLMFDLFKRDSKMNLKRILLALTGLFLLSLISGCGVRVWERDILAKPQMQFQFRNHDHLIDDHIYFSKEAASGGRGFGGGGCGCN